MTPEDLLTRRAKLEQRLQDLADEVMRASPELAVGYAARAQITEIALRVVEAQIVRMPS